MRSHWQRSGLVAALAALLVQSAAAHGIEVGRTATNQIAIQIEGTPPFDLPPSEFAGFPGFADVEPGFSSLDADQADLFTLPDAADLEFVLRATTPHIFIFNEELPGNMHTGDAYHLGHPEFAVHPLWHSPDGVVGGVYTVTIQLHDRAGVLSDSELIALDFSPVPEPASAALLLLATTVTLRRR